MSACTLGGRRANDGRRDFQKVEPLPVAYCSLLPADQKQRDARERTAAMQEAVVVESAQRARSALPASDGHLASIWP